MKNNVNNGLLRFLCLLLACITVFGLTACQKKYSDPTQQFVAALDSLSEEAVKNSEKNGNSDVFDGLEDINGKKTTLAIQPVLSETLVKMIGEELPVDVSVINNLKLILDVSAKDELAKLALSLGYADSNVFGISGILDVKQLGAYVNISAGADKALFFDIKSLLDELDKETVDKLKDSFKSNSADVKEIIPVITDYYKMLYAGAADVQSFKDNFTVGSLSSEMTVLTWSASDKVVYDTCIAIVEKFVADDRIKPIFEQFCDSEEEADEAYSEIIDAAKQFLENEKNDPTETTGATILTTRLYVDKNNDIYGIDVIVCDARGAEQFSFSSGALEVGDDFAFNTSVFGEELPKIELSASGSDVKDVVNCTVTATYDGKQVAALTVKDLDCSKADDGICKGSVRLKPGSGLASLPYIDPTTAIAIGMFGLNVEFDSDGNKSQCLVSVEMNNANLAGISFTVESGEVDAISVPADYVNDPNVWVMSLDLEKILTSIENSELPDELVDLLAGLFNGQ